MKLIIVESPTKAKTLSKFLKGEYTVEASVGHIRDLPKSELGVDTANNFIPKYIIPKEKQKRVSELKDIAAKADSIVLATDPDREGEAIAWHVAHILIHSTKKKNQKSKKKDQEEKEVTSPDQYSRIVFHEITESAIQEALEHPRIVDMKLVDAQQARRVLDRLVGYNLSPLLWKKLSKRWLSAGRVQSVAVRLLVEREREIEKFTKESYWTIDVVFSKDNTDVMLPAHLVRYNGTAYEETISLILFDGEYKTTKSSIRSEEEAKHIIQQCIEPFTIQSVDQKEIKRSPPAPYTTSTMQQDAGRKLSFSSKKTMQTAQRLYEEGFITYHRTDSVNLSEKFLHESREYLSKQYGNEYIPDKARTFTTKSKVAQEAHEAIRPTDMNIQFHEIEGKGELNRDHVRLYELIWKRAVASQMKEAIFNSTTVVISNEKGYEFEAKGSVIVFEGYLKVAGRDSTDVVIPQLSQGDHLRLVSSTLLPHETQAPPRYTEASLVKTMEEKDIGRPSTYAPIISTIIERQYVIKEEKKLVPTELGKSVTDFLVQYFSDVMSLPFTADLESKLDAIANGEKEWVPVIAEFYKDFEKEVQITEDIAEKVKVVEETLDESCPDCNGQLVIKMGRYGKFIACSNFPTCKYTRQFLEAINIPCPTCGNPMVVKKTRKGKTFYGCSSYPTCTFAAWKKEDIK
jgi:DNA topoisomerase-1